MKKLLALLLCLALCLSLFAGCANTTESAYADDQIKIVTTIFPLYDWTVNMIGEDAENYSVHLLNNSGVDMHSYQATTADIITIYDCDLFIYVGGESDAWVEDILANKTNPDMKILNLVEVLGDRVVYEELIEGMEATEHNHDHDDEEEEHDHDEEEEEHDHDEECEDECCDEDHDHEHEDECCDEDHDHDEECEDECCEEDHDHEHEDECCDEDHDHEHEDECCDEEIDEHIWLSLQNAQIACAAIADTLALIDSDSASTYMSNLESYIASLKALDSEYADMVANANRDTLLFADRFPFRYLVDDYGLNYYAAFAGCSAETEASFETVVFLAGKVDELDLDVVLTISGVTHEIAETVIAASSTGGQTIMEVSSMESVTSADIAAGTTYLSVMKDNLDIFAAALN